MDSIGKIFEEKTLQYLKSQKTYIDIKADRLLADVLEVDIVGYNPDGSIDIIECQVRRNNVPYSTG